MRWLLYLRLILLTAGTLLPFFWMVVILGHRRQRNFERVFFFLCLALTCFFGSSLLALNAELLLRHSAEWSAPLCMDVSVPGAWFRSCAGGPSSCRIRFAPRSGGHFLRKRLLGCCFLGWLAISIAGELVHALRLEQGFDFETPTHTSWGWHFKFGWSLAMLLAAYWQRRFAKTAPDREQRAFHKIHANGPLRYGSCSCC